MQHRWEFSQEYSWTVREHLTSENVTISDSKKGDWSQATRLWFTLFIKLMQSSQQTLIHTRPELQYPTASKKILLFQCSLWRGNDLIFNIRRDFIINQLNMWFSAKDIQPQVCNSIKSNIKHSELYWHLDDFYNHRCRCGALQWGLADHMIVLQI